MRMTAAAILGYAWVSTIGQDLDAQLAALTVAGVDSARVFIDKFSGSAKTARPGLAAMLHYPRPGDTVTIVSAWKPLIESSPASQVPPPYEPPAIRLIRSIARRRLSLPAAADSTSQPFDANSLTRVV